MKKLIRASEQSKSIKHDDKYSDDFIDAQSEALDGACAEYVDKYCDDLDDPVRDVQWESDRGGVLITVEYEDESTREIHYNNDEFDAIPIRELKTHIFNRIDTEF